MGKRRYTNKQLYRRKDHLPLFRLHYLKGIFLIVFLSFTARAAAPELKVNYLLAPAPINPYDKLIEAIIQVESEGDNLAYNSEEGAIGAFQIRPIRLRDYNMRTGKNYLPEDLFRFDVSREIFLHYAIKIGYPNFESIARKWNGSGKTTLEYWKKVQNYLQ